ncbi:MAG: hypothetical protein KJ737_25155 [Proteobacteria bacterium]|nr:hypothetical protein [Pseudomonadota bacterium]
MSISRYFNENQLKGLIKTGDIILPGTNKSPSFSQTGCVLYIDRMLAYLTDDDLNGLRLVFGIFRWSPKWIIRFVLKGCKNNQNLPGFLGAGLRMLELGINGAVMSPYYANLCSADYKGPKVFDIIGWDAKMVVPDDVV